VTGGHLCVVGGVEPCDPVVEDGQAVGSHLAVVADALKPEPDGVAAVVAGAAAAAQQVRYQPVTQAAAVRQDQDTRLVVARRDQHQTAHRDERVSTPVAEDAVREVRQSWNNNDKNNDQLISIRQAAA